MRNANYRSLHGHQTLLHQPRQSIRHVQSIGSAINEAIVAKTSSAEIKSRKARTMRISMTASIYLEQAVYRATSHSSVRACTDIKIINDTTTKLSTLVKFIRAVSCVLAIRYRKYRAATRCIGAYTRVPAGMVGLS
jgi:hypothetical protein